MTKTAMAAMAAANAWYPDARIPFAELGAPAAGDGDGTSKASCTLMTSFWPCEQCFGFPQMYHFFPLVLRGIMSYPVVKASLGGGTSQLWNAVPLTLKTL